MKVPISWLKQYVATRQNSKEIAKKLTAIGHMQDGPVQSVHGDQIIDLEIRQNRSDCLSIIGIARELGAIDKKRILYPELASNEVVKAKFGDWRVQINEPKLCYRFNSIKIDNIRVTTSPPWLKKALLSYGMEPINNIVDITNYVMIELGQPLHAFDSKHIKKKIIVRRALKNEKFTALGGRIFALTEDDLVIANDHTILAFAGIIGGNNSGVTDSTTSIILEAANYNQASVRRSSIRHNIRTEASLRLEKFLSSLLPSQALSRAVYLIKQICGGTVVGVDDACTISITPIKIKLEIAQFEKLSGISIKKKEIISILSYLEFQDVVVNTKSIVATVPYFRTDITCEEDLIEEILRIYGYDSIPEALPNEPTPNDIQSRLYDFEENIRDTMTALQFDEHITEPLTDKSENGKNPIKLQNSLSSQKQQLRTSLQSGLMKVRDNYHKHRKEDIRVYEIGKIYFRTTKYLEERTLGVLLSYKGVTYSDIKGVIETVAIELGRTIKETDYFITLIDNVTLYAEISIEKLFGNKKTESITVLTSPPKLVLQDLSLVSPQRVEVGQVLQSLKNCDDQVFEVMLGENPKDLGDGYKSMFIKLSFSSPDNANVSKDKVDKLRIKILKMLKSKYKIKLQ